MENTKKGISRYAFLAAGTIALLFLGLIYAWSIFKAPIKGLLPTITDKNLSLTFTISMIFFCIGGFISGQLSKKLNTRIRLIIATWLVFLGLILMSTLSADTANPVIKMYIYYGVLCGSGVGMAYNAILSGVLPNFTNSIGMASGLLMLGFGFGALTLGSLASYLETLYGIKTTFLILSIIFLPPLFACSFIIGKNCKNAEIPVNNSEDSDEKNYSPKEMIKTKFFIWFVVWNVLVCSCGLMIIGSASQIALSLGAPAIAGLLVSVANGGGRILAGKVFDKKGETISIFMPCLFLLAAGALLLLSNLATLPLVGLIGLLFVGISFGCSPTLASSLIKTVYGSKNYPTNFSIINFQLILAATIGPTLSNYLKSRSGGSFTMSFIAILIFSAAAILVSVIMKKVRKTV